MWADRDRLTLAGIWGVSSTGRGVPLAVLYLHYRLVEYLRVKLEANGVDVTALLRPQDITCAPYLQVSHGDSEAGA